MWKAFLGYLGPQEEQWKAYDSVELIKTYSGPPREILIDQGTADEFLAKKQLLPENLQNLDNDKVKVKLRYQEDYDHSYLFIATFIEEHFAFHSGILSQKIPDK
ncbi:unnamed protein product [Gongylonema pulchrum]|uniref:S-formylglutathione hydrolase n=1 Tax=Gongylonema pulchrum TaxID=637853 RepID=A0A183DYC1_9BILA|nr:unnamed protein product [Gongylonema pulchrum]